MSDFCFYAPNGDKRCIFLALDVLIFSYNFEYMNVVTGGRDCPTNSNKHTLQLDEDKNCGDAPLSLLCCN